MGFVERSDPMGLGCELSETLYHRDNALLYIAYVMQGRIQDFRNGPGNC